MDTPLLLDYASRISADLERNILPFWMAHAADPSGGFRGAVSDTLVVDPEAPRGMLLTARILWTFSAAYREIHDEKLLAFARRAHADLVGRFHDTRHGGFFWSIDPTGAPLESRKQIYGQAFAVYALSEFHRATGEPTPLALALETARLIERHARDDEHGGWLEAFARDWSHIPDVRLSAVDLNEPKSQNTHLHVMEAYAGLLRAHPAAPIRLALADMLRTMLDRILDPRTGHLGLFFALDWTRRSETLSYGHDIEAAWLMHDAASTLGDPDLLLRVRRAALRIAETTLAEGIDEDGALFNAGTAAGPTDTDKEWWPQAEAVVGFLDVYSLSGDDRHLRAALRAWDFIESRLIDRRHGEWIRGVSRDGLPLVGHDKIGFWKCPYHNGRMALEASRRLRALAAEAVSRSTSLRTP
jgi:mannobiose 2-epimerase